MVTKKDYREAVENPSIRPKFVKSIDLEDIGIYVNRILYKPRPRGKSLMDTVFKMPNIEKKSNIIIYPSAFSPSYHPRLDDFLGSLIDHEGFHAEEFSNASFNYMRYLGFLRILGKDEEYLIEETKLEIRAYQNQIDNFNKRDFSQEYINRIQSSKDRYKRTYLELIEREELLKTNT